jgi:hypothetical protein
MPDTLGKSLPTQRINDVHRISHACNTLDSCTFTAYFPDRITVLENVVALLIMGEHPDFTLPHSAENNCK